MVVPVEHLGSGIRPLEYVHALVAMMQLVFVAVSLQHVTTPPVVVHTSCNGGRCIPGCIAAAPASALPRCVGLCVMSVGWQSYNTHNITPAEGATLCFRKPACVWVVR